MFLFRPFVTYYNEDFRTMWSRHSVSVLSMAFLGVISLFVLWYVFVIRGSQSPKADLLNFLGGHQLDSELRQSFEQLDMDQADWEEAQQEGRRREEIALAEYQVLCIDQLAKRAKLTVDACRREASSWNKELDDFKKAAIDWDDPKNLVQLGHVEMLLSLEMPTQSEVDTFQDQLKILTAPLNYSESTGKIVPVSESLEGRIQALKEKADQTRKLFSRRRAMLQAIRSKTVETDDKSKADDLDSVLEQHKTDVAAAIQGRIAKRLADARQSDEKIARDARQKAEATLAEAKEYAAKIDSQIDTRRAESDTKYQAELEKLATAKEQQQADRKELLRDFERDLPDIRKNLRLFLTPTNYHPVNQTVPHKVPISYSALEAVNALKPDVVGYGQLSNLVKQMNRKDPKMFFASANTSKLVWQSQTRDKAGIMRMQAYLRKYGLLMVEKKMLTP